MHLKHQAKQTKQNKANKQTKTKQKQKNKTKQKNKAKQKTKQNKNKQINKQTNKQTKKKHNTTKQNKTKTNNNIMAYIRLFGENLKISIFLEKKKSVKSSFLYSEVIVTSNKGLLASFDITGKKKSIPIL